MSCGKHIKMSQIVNFLCLHMARARRKKSQNQSFSGDSRKRRR
jgi:hypothetical protein